MGKRRAPRGKDGECWLGWLGHWPWSAADGQERDKSPWLISSHKERMLFSEFKEAMLKLIVAVKEKSKMDGLLQREAEQCSSK